MRMMSEETFGPVAGLFPFSTEKDVVDMANQAEVGLAGYFYSKDIQRCYRVAEALETGMIGYVYLIGAELALRMLITDQVSTPDSSAIQHCHLEASNTVVLGEKEASMESRNIRRSRPLLWAAWVKTCSHRRLRRARSRICEYVGASTSKTKTNYIPGEIPQQRPIVPDLRPQPSWTPESCQGGI